MKQIDRTVLKETAYIAVWTGIFSIVLQAVFLIVGKWDITVLLGNLLGAFTVILNFFLMGISVQNAVAKEEKEAKSIIKASQALRTLMVFLLVLIGAVLPVFSIWTVIIPLFFPRIAIALRPLTDKSSNAKGGND